nr:MAG TPA: hypothetical protein [Caudoviricetes sp.]
MMQYYNIIDNKIYKNEYYNIGDTKTSNNEYESISFYSIKFLLLESITTGWLYVCIAYKVDLGDICRYYHTSACRFNPEYDLDRIDEITMPKLDDDNAYEIQEKRVLIEHDFISYDLKDYKHLLAEFLL